MRYSSQAYAEAFVRALTSSTSDKHSALRKRFVRLLEKNGDMQRANAILKRIQTTLVHNEGGRMIVVEFARPQYPALVKKILAQFSKKDSVEVTVNPDLIAGVRITIDGSSQIDATLARKLQKLFS